MVGVYHPPSAKKVLLNQLFDLLACFMSSEVVVLGDFNLNWLTDDSDHIKELCDGLNLNQLITKPTHPKSSLIDYILTNIYISQLVYCPSALVTTVLLCVSQMSETLNPNLGLLLKGIKKMFMSKISQMLRKC